MSFLKFLICNAKKINDTKLSQIKKQNKWGFQIRFLKDTRVAKI